MAKNRFPLTSFDRRVALELVETERNYVSSLKCVKEEVVDRLVEDSEMVLDSLLTFFWREEEKGSWGVFVEIFLLSSSLSLSFSISNMHI